MKPKPSQNIANTYMPPSVKLPLKLRLRGNDAWIEDADGREAVSQTRGFITARKHEQWLRWIVRTANTSLKGMPATLTAWPAIIGGGCRCLTPAMRHAARAPEHFCQLNNRK